MPSSFQHERRVEFADTDCAGILHFAAFFRYIEEAEHAFLRSLGLSVHAPQGDGSIIGFPRVSARCEYLRSAVFEDVLAIDLWVSRIGRRTIEYSFELSRGGEPVARALAVVIACRVRDRASIESIDLPDAFRGALRVDTRPAVAFRGAAAAEGGRA